MMDDDDMLVDPIRSVDPIDDALTPSGGHMSSLVSELEKECMHWRTLYDEQQQRGRSLQRELEAASLWRAQAERCLRRCIDVARDVRASELTRPPPSLSGASPSSRKALSYDDDDDMTVSMKRIEQLSEIIQEASELAGPGTGLSSSREAVGSMRSPSARQDVSQTSSVHRTRRGRPLHVDASDSDAKFLALRNIAQHSAQRRLAVAVQTSLAYMGTTRTLSLLRKYFCAWLTEASERRRIKIVSAQLYRLRRSVLVSVVEHRILFQTFARRYFSHWRMVCEVRRLTRNMRSLIGLFSKQSVMLATQIKNQHELSAMLVEDCAALLGQQSSVLNQLDLATLPQIDSTQQQKLL